MKPKAPRVLLWTALGFFIVAVALIAIALSIGGWDSILPTALGALSGLLAMVLAVIASIVAGANYSKRVSRWTDQQAKSKRMKRDFSILGGVLGSLILLFMMTCIGPVQTIQRNIDTIRSLVAGFPDNFTVQKDGTDSVHQEADSVIRVCLPGAYCYVDSEIHLEAPSNISTPDFCKIYIAWALKNGGTDISDGFDSLAIKKYPLESQLACVASGRSVSVEGTKNGVLWNSDSFPYIFVTTSDSPLFEGVSSAFETRLNSGDRLFAVLDRIGGWRKGHPGVKETVSTIKKAVKDLDGISKYKVFTDSNGVGPMLAYKSAKDSLVYCVRVAPWDEKFFGMPDPGHGYYPVNNGAPNQFGWYSITYSLDTCVSKAGK